MPKQSSIVDRFQIPNPCNADWNSMLGNDEVRFCEHCAKHVHNLTEMTLAEAEQLVIDSNGKLCVRYQRFQDGSVKTIDRTQHVYQLARKVSKLAASAFAVALTVSSGAIAKPSQARQVASSFREKESPAITDDIQSQETRMFAGTVITDNGKPVYGATITLEGRTTGYVYSTTSAGFGVFCLDDLPTEVYDVSVSAPKFKTMLIAEVDSAVNPVTKLNLRMHEGDPSEVIVQEYTIDLPLMGGVMAIELRREIPGVDYKTLAKFESGKISADRLNGLTMMLALQNAVSSDKLDRVKSLLAAGADTNGLYRESENEGRHEILIPPTLFSITSETNVEVVARLIQAGADVNMKGEGGRTPAMMAALARNSDALKEFVRYGANVADEDTNGWDVLSYWVSQDNIEGVKLLIEAGADVNHKDKGGSTTLIRVLGSNFQSTVQTRDIIRLLKQQGATEFIEKPNDKTNSNN